MLLLQFVPGAHQQTTVAISGATTAAQ